jgi:hypothetical protein
MRPRITDLLEGLHWLWVAVVLIYAAAQLGVAPNVERAVLLYFAPPVIACALIAVNVARGTNQQVIWLCKLFLTTIAVGVLLGEQQILFANVKPQFPGVPPQQDRVLIFYFAAYMLFIGVFLPAFFLGTSLLLHYQKRNAPISLGTCLVGAATWIGCMIVVVALSPRIFARLF